MSIEWYKAYHGMPYDPKLQVISKRTGQPMTHVVSIWTCLLDAASRHEPRGVIDIDPEQIAVVQDIDLQAVQDILKAFYTKNMIDAQHRLTAWDKRQQNTSTERSRQHREQKKGGKKKHDATPRNGMQQNATPGNGEQRENGKKAQDREIEKESKKEDTEKDLDKDLRAGEEKGERERKKPKTCGKDEEKKGIQDKKGIQILEQMLDTWNEEVQNKLTRGQKAILTPTRKEQMTQRWLEDFQQDMRAWRHYCQIIGASDFCLGKIPGKGWTIDLSWAVESSDHVAKVLEGGFSGGNHPPQPPACEVPDLQEAWDSVLQVFEREHGKAVCRSWLANTVITGIHKHRDGAMITLRCPSKFSCEWITQHYLADLNRLWADATAKGARVIGLELVTDA